MGVVYSAAPAPLGVTCACGGGGGTVGVCGTGAGACVGDALGGPSSCTFFGDSFSTGVDTCFLSVETGGGSPFLPAPFTDHTIFFAIVLMFNEYVFYILNNYL